MAYIGAWRLLRCGKHSYVLVEYLDLRTEIREFLWIVCLVRFNNRSIRVRCLVPLMLCQHMASLVSKTNKSADNEMAKFGNEKKSWRGTSSESKVANQMLADLFQTIPFADVISDGLCGELNGAWNDRRRTALHGLEGYGDKVNGRKGQTTLFRHRASCKWRWK